MTNPRNIVMEGVRIILRNFAGRETQMNQEGDRNFGVILDEDVAAELYSLGLNVKRLKPREEDEGEEGTPWLPVKISWKNRPPLVYMITSRGRSRLDEDMIDLLDVADITNVDMIINPYNWEFAGKTGVKAYVESMYVTIEEDQLAKKYGDIPEVRTRSGRIDDGDDGHDDYRP